MASDIKLLTENEWSTMYPTAQYKSKSATLLFHFLLALNQPEETILEQIKKKQNLLVIVDSENEGLTPLIIATMQGKAVIVQAILDSWKSLPNKKTLVNVCDIHNWSSLEHARLSSRQIYQLLVAFGASQETTIPLKDLRLMRAERVDSYTLKKVFVETGEGPLLSLENYGFGKIGLESYRDIPYYSDSTLAILWRKTNRAKKSPLQEALKRFLANPPKFILGKCHELESSEHPFELKAGELIPAGACVGVYSGEAIVEPKKIYPSMVASLKEKLQREAYLLEDLDARRMGNMSRMSNWGWPNVTCTSATIHGQKLPIFISLEAISEGEPLLWNYTTMAALALDVPTPILGAEKMRSFYKQGFNAIYEKFRQLEAEKFVPTALNDEELPIDNYCLLHRYYEALVFPLNFPAALLDLHFRDIVPIQKWVEFTNDITKSNSVILNQWHRKVEYSYFIMRAICFHVWKLNKLTPANLKDFLSKWMLDRIGKFSMLQLIKGITMFTVGFEKGSITSEKWEEVADHIHNFMSTYVAADDKDCPLGPKEIWQHKLMIMEEDQNRSTQEKIDYLKSAIEKLRAEGLPEDHDAVIETNWLLTFHQTRLKDEKK